MINRRILMGALASVAAPGLSAPYARAQGLQKISVGVVRSPSQAGTYIGIEKGFFRDRGIEVNPIFFDSSSSIFTGLVTGDIDLALTGTTASAFNLARKGGFKIIGAGNQERRGFSINAFLASNRSFEAGFTRLADMRGKRIAITTAGSTYHYYLGLFAKKFAFPLSQIEMVPLNSLANVAAAVKTGQVDGGMLPPAFARSLTEANLARFLAWTGDEVKFDVAVIATGNKALSEKRGALLKFLQAQLQATKYYADHYYKVAPDGTVLEGDEYAELAEIIARGAGVRTGDLKGAFIYLSENLRFNPNDLLSQVNFWEEQGIVEKGFDFTKIMDASLLDEIKV